MTELGNGRLAAPVFDLLKTPASFRCDAENTMQVKGHAALITGGGSGLGAATARALAAQGAKVAILDVNLENAQKVARETGGIAVKCDVADAASAEAAVAEARAKNGAARILINCAGIGPAARIVGKDGPMPLGEFAKVININLIGSFNMMRLAGADAQKLEPLADGERGIIISTASVAAFEGQIGQAAYAASKGGVVALTMPAAREFARFGIRVMAIAPGLFGTPMLLGMPQTVQDSLAASVPFPTRFGTPEEYAKLAMHIIDNAMLNGEVIRLDGAIRMQPK
jgi:NAD(P)-dependent dehydrogenase (short-subunit alcohol dehydrogenase family)